MSKLLASVALPAAEAPPPAPARSSPAGNPDPLWNCKEVATYLGVTEAGVWIGVAGGRIPPPYYPLSRSPRWRPAEIAAALEATRSTPAKQRAARRADRVARERDTAPAA